ncbi:hypothetical protein LOTGIDRAFT_155007 [Lottia gigantea]|uniref:Uncharacterized protein n=1 Tax=Lottia gigantea TaxID=225164 RepID=V3ZSH5_LOTGI|nr:hypothetical protein LOTGIDRAFT_155007 [Lottia gigantea]ESO85520.1 hypothetical protein LOTGIDRAFT_155007 [Lottia gigantea]
MANKILDPIFKLYNPIRYSFNKKKENYIIISTTVGSKSQLNDVGRITFKINSLSNWLLLSDAYFRCDFKIKDGTPNENRVPQTNTTLENNFFPSLFSEMVLEAGSRPIETIKHPGEFDTMLKTVLYPKDFAAAAATGGISAAVKAANAKKAADAKAAEERRHNLIIEKEAKGSGVGDMIGTIKEFGKRFGEETKKTVKQGLNNLVHSIDTGEVKVKHKGNGIYTGEGLFLSKYKGEGVIFGIK